jgi:hypothetical protein
MAKRKNKAGLTEMREVRVVGTVNLVALKSIPGWDKLSPPEQAQHVILQLAKSEDLNWNRMGVFDPPYSDGSLFGPAKFFPEDN